jgi:hypothetical protein
VCSAPAGEMIATKRNKYQRGIHEYAVQNWCTVRYGKRGSKERRTCGKVGILLLPKPLCCHQVSKSLQRMIVKVLPPISAFTKYRLKLKDT